MNGSVKLQNDKHNRAKRGSSWTGKNSQPEQRKILVQKSLKFNEEAA